MQRTSWVALAVVLVAVLALYHWRDAVTAYVRGADVQTTAQAAPEQGTGSSRQAGGSQARTGAGGRSGGNGPAPQVVTAEASSGDLPIRRETIGWIVSANTTELASQTQGVVTEVVAGDGADLKKGDLVVRLDPRVAEAAVARDTAAVQRDQATLEQAQRTLSNAQTLAQRGAATQESFRTAQSAAASAEATVALDNAALAADQVTLSNTQIRAPFDGRLGAIGVTVGTVVQPGAQVVTITQMAPVEAQFAVSEGDLPLLRGAYAAKQARATVRPPGDDAAASRPSGLVTFIDSTVERASGTVQARATLPNADLQLWPGESVGVTVDLGVRPDVVLVPTVAVAQSASGPIVYVVNQQSSIEVRTVQVAGADGDRTGLDGGLKTGEHVVVEGQMNLTAGQRVAEAPPGGKTAAARSSVPATE